MKSRQIFIAILILASLCGAAAAQPRKTKSQVEAPQERPPVVTNYAQSDSVLPGLIAAKAQMPLGPQDVLKSYEIGMSLIADKTSTDFSVIVQAQQANQITREQAEYLLQQRYQVAMMQYQVLSSLHDVLKHDIDEANQEAHGTFKAANSNTVLVVPLPGSSLEGR
jgi:hypothetical protein